MGTRIILREYKMSNSKYISKIEPKGFPNALDVVHERKRIKKTSETFDLSNWKDGAAIN